ncbi:MAG: anti-sigma factor antagonist, partial [Opitutaceae bacterium]|nr:anti-sigma factor antagonist [Opitutaceae bacterium]
MPASAANTFLVAPDADPVLIVIEGRASFQNSAGINRFLAAQRAAGKRNYAMDFAACTTMDS